jgi:hypothetical protein
MGRKANEHMKRAGQRGNVSFLVIIQATQGHHQAPDFQQGYRTVPSAGIDSTQFGSVKKISRYSNRYTAAMQSTWKFIQA